MTSGTFNTLPLEIYGMTTNVTTPVLYALGTVTTLFHLGTPPPPASRQRRRQGGMSAPQSMRRRARVLRLPTKGPQDTAPLAAAIDRGDIDPATIVAIVGKTEGNGCVNDFTRGYATLALKLLLAERLKCQMAEVEARVAIVMSGGTEGGLSPHLLVFCREPATAAAPGARLAIGVGLTRLFKPEEIGRTAQIAATAEAVAAAMKDAGIATAADVHFVQIKCPLLTKERIEEAERRGAAVATDDTYHSMALSRGASALGIALALNEIDDAPEAAVCRDWSLYSKVASTSAGVELLRNEIVVLGNSSAWAGDLVIDHDVMGDAIDADAARRVLARLRGETIAVLAKAEASPTGEIRGRRHTMLDDSDIHSTRHARALVGGVLAGVIGDTLLYVSGGAEHQGPPGGGPVAIIGKV
jgi:cyanuric acid amidohydrolase